MIDFLVAVVISLTGSDSFAVREAASRTLADIGPAALPQLERSIYDRDPEVVRRSAIAIEAINSRITSSSVESILSQFPQVPFIDSLPESYPKYRIVVSEYRERAVSLGASRNVFNLDGTEDWPADRIGTVLWVRDLVGSGTNPDMVACLLQAMDDRSRFYQRNRHWPSEREARD